MFFRHEKKPFERNKRLFGALTLSFIFVFALTMLTSCGMGVRSRSLFGGKVNVDVTVSESANKNNPVAVDYILVYNEDLLKELLKTPAKEWFEKKNQFKRDYPEDTGFASFEWEWIPGQSVPPLAMPLEARAKGAFVFALYFSKGDHRAHLDPHKSFKLMLLEDTFRVEPR